MGCIPIRIIQVLEEYIIFIYPLKNDLFMYFISVYCIQNITFILNDYLTILFWISACLNNFNSTSTGWPTQISSVLVNLSRLQMERVSAPQPMPVYFKYTSRKADYICFNSYMYVINNFLDEYIIAIYSCTSSLMFIN